MNCKNCELRNEVAKTVTGRGVNPETGLCAICEKAECNACQEAIARNDRMMPNHFASSRCESGQHNHCTCDTCY